MNNISFDYDTAGDRMYALMTELWPLHRSIAGPGLRQTLSQIQKHIPIKIHEVPSGTEVFDWRVPQEWECRDAFIMDDTGKRVVDYQHSNLHIVNHSIAVQKKMNWSELKPHLHYSNKHPDWIPYRTAYFKKEWGFCLSRSQYLELEKHGDRIYKVSIDASFRNGSLSYGELYLSGSSQNEMLISSHICHPSLANDNLSGTALAVSLAEYLSGSNRNLSYRLVFLPATIGAITWLSRNQSQLERIKYGLVLAGLGDPGPLTYKKSRSGSEIDRVTSYVMEKSGRDFSILEFRPDGYDERQYCSPESNLPLGRLSRSPEGIYPQYHTSADNLDFVTPTSMADSFKTVIKIVNILDRNRYFLNSHPWCEPPLGQYGLYSKPGPAAIRGLDPLAVQWVLNLSDGNHSLFDIVLCSGLPFPKILGAAEALFAHNLLTEKPQIALSPASNSSRLSNKAKRKEELS